MQRSIIISTPGIEEGRVECKNEMCYNNMELTRKGCDKFSFSVDGYVTRNDSSFTF